MLLCSSSHAHIFDMPAQGWAMLALQPVPPVYARVNQCDELWLAMEEDKEFQLQIPGCSPQRKRRPIQISHPAPNDPLAAFSMSKAANIPPSCVKHRRSCPPWRLRPQARRLLINTCTGMQASVHNKPKWQKIGLAWK